MKSFVIAATVAVAFAGGAQAAGCTPAQQNWVSGSRTTCPLDMKGKSQVATVTPGVPEAPEIPETSPPPEPTTTNTVVN